MKRIIKIKKDANEIIENITKNDELVELLRTTASQDFGLPKELIEYTNKGGYKMNTQINEMEEVSIYFSKIKEEAKIPSKSDENAGYDIYACFDEKYMKINPLETLMIPTGIASAIPLTHYFQFFERGSTGTKGIAQRCGVIDSGFRGEWFVPVTNVNEKYLFIVKDIDIKDSESVDKFLESISTDEMVYNSDNSRIYPYNKAISQAVLLPVPKTVVKEVSYDELLNFKSNRMSGSLGSSGK